MEVLTDSAIQVPTYSGEIMPMPLRASPSLYQTTRNLACVVLMSIAMWGCSTQPAYTPPPAIAPPPPPPVAALPPPKAPAKVTTASFYGPGFQGHSTSSGETYNQHALTAASRTLPIGSHAKVTNLKTGKSVVVRINDHGPFVHGRGIDLSSAAARRIGIDHHHGTAKVAVTRVDHDDDAMPDASTKTATAHDTSPKAAGDSGSAMPPVMESSILPTSMGAAAKESPPPAK
jgi:rare lipoprotein A